MSAEPRPQLAELLVDRALVGLSSAEELALERLQDESGAAAAALDAHELAAAALDQALAPAREPLPAALRARLVAAAANFTPPARTLRALSRIETAARTPSPLFGLTGWLVAAVAALVAVLSLREPSTATPAEQRSALLARADTLRLACSATEQAPGASGDVAWSQALQQGVLHLVGLKANDPALEQYQLWIFDEGQVHPVDGGVFDIDSGEVLIPIDAKLMVQRPTLFAITVEKPGGVVVSDQKHIVLVAKI